jgi:AcrR family transcriptional regulator
VDAALLDAADALLAEGGYAAVTVVMAAVARHEDPDPAGDTGGLVEDLRAVARSVATVTARPAFATVLPGLLVDLADEPATRAALLGEWVAPRAASLADALVRAAGRGEIAVEAAGEQTVLALAELLVGPLLYRALLAGAPASAAEAEVVADRALLALGLGPQTHTAG